MLYNNATFCVHVFVSTSVDLFLSFSMPQTSRKIFNKSFEFLLYETNNN